MFSSHTTAGINKQKIRSHRNVEISTGRLYSNLNTPVKKVYVIKQRIDDRTNKDELSVELEVLLVERQERKASQFPETATG